MVRAGEEGRGHRVSEPTRDNLQLQIQRQLVQFQLQERRQQELQKTMSRQLVGEFSIGAGLPLSGLCSLATVASMATPVSAPHTQTVYHAPPLIQLGTSPQTLMRQLPLRTQSQPPPYLSKRTKPRRKRPTGEPRYKCPMLECGRRFHQRSNMVVHIRTHSLERPFACGVCHRAFCQSSNLRRHLKVHSDQPNLLHAAMSECTRMMDERVAAHRLNQAPLLTLPEVQSLRQQCVKLQAARNVRTVAYVAKYPSSAGAAAYAKEMAGKRNRLAC